MDASYVLNKEKIRLAEGLSVKTFLQIKPHKILNLFIFQLWITYFISALGDLKSFNLQKTFQGFGDDTPERYIIVIENFMEMFPSLLHLSNFVNKA